MILAQNILTVPLPSSFLGNPLSLFWLIVIVGFATAAFVQWGKEFFGWRRQFHHLVVHQWVDRRISRITPGIVRALFFQDGEVDPKKASRIPRDEVMKHLDLLMGNEYDEDPRRAVPTYSLSAEQLCGQIATAAEVVIAFPDRYPELFAVFTCAANAPSPKDAEEYIALSRDRSRAQQARYNSVLNEGDEREERYGDLRGQFAILAQRSVDSLQIIIGERWRRRLTMFCMLFSFAFSVVIVVFMLTGDSSVDSMTSGKIAGIALFTFGVIAVAGTLAAPIAHDLMRAVRAFGRR